jgi:hypothetical protein
VDARLSDEQELLRRSARDFLMRQCPMAFVREKLESASPCDEALWKRLAELGFLGLAIPAELGGAGLGAMDLCVLLEETGRALLPGPFFSTLFGALLIAEAGSPAQRARWLASIAGGGARVGVALHEGSPDEAGFSAAAADGGFRLDGVKRFVPDADAVQAIAVPAREGPRAPLQLFVVETAAPGVSIRRIAHADGTRTLCELTLRSVAVPEDARLAGDAAPEPALGRACDRAKVALAAEMCGAADRVLELSVAYAKTREQFGRPIGSFQAIQHRCADMLVAVESARSATWLAAAAIDQGDPEAHALACMAKAYASEKLLRVAGDGIQIHGGQGFTWEQDLHLYYRRAAASAQRLGDAVYNRELAARALFDGGVA